jgi:HKD family nuclease
MKWKLVAQGGAVTTSLSKAITTATSDGAFNRLDVAVAYATLPGVKALEIALGGIPPKSRWVIGLDDAISQPEAIKYLVNMPGSTVRLAKMAPAQRFHPKLYRLWSSELAELCVTVIGSGNMTQRGLRSNGETAAILTAESAEDAAEMKKQWKAMWRLGHDPEPDEIAEYEKTYEKAKKQRKKISDMGAAPPEPDPSDPVEEEPSYTGTPASAHIAWLEAGSANAGGRDLEFPKAMMPFFGLKKKKEVRAFAVGGQEFDLTFTERLSNQMWRLMFTRDAIQAAVGRDSLRPHSGVNRSDLTIIFQRIPGTKKFDLAMVPIGSAEHDKTLARSKGIGGYFTTTRNPGGRKFGFY